MNDNLVNKSGDLVNDTISRTAAIDAVMKMPTVKNENGEKFVHQELTKIRIEILPPAQTERKTGRWIIHYGNWADLYECDQCHLTSREAGNYCRGCGAKMDYCREQ